MTSTTRLKFLILCFCRRYKIFCSHNNTRTLFETADQELSQVNDWFLANKLSLNAEKPKYILFHKPTDQENIPLKLPSLQLNRNITERENSLKLLCVILDEHSTWKKQCNLLKIRSEKCWCSL